MASRNVNYRFIAANGMTINGNMPFDDDNPGSNYDRLKSLWSQHFDRNADFEHVLVWNGEKYVDMFVDEEGRLKGLALNFKATDIYRANILQHEANPPPPSTMPAIFGDVLLFEERIWT